jgi:hypothetical protein
MVKNSNILINDYKIEIGTGKIKILLILKPEKNKSQDM